MPVEIKELVIRTIVNDDSSQQNLEGAVEGVSNQDQIIADCVDQVMEILKEKKER